MDHVVADANQHNQHWPQMPIRTAALLCLLRGEVLLLCSWRPKAGVVLLAPFVHCFKLEITATPTYSTGRVAVLHEVLQLSTRSQITKKYYDNDMYML